MLISKIFIGILVICIIGYLISIVVLMTLSISKQNNEVKNYEKFAKNYCDFIMAGVNKNLSCKNHIKCTEAYHKMGKQLNPDIICKYCQDYIKEK